MTRYEVYCGDLIRLLQSLAAHNVSLLHVRYISDICASFQTMSGDENIVLSLVKKYGGEARVKRPKKLISYLKAYAVLICIAALTVVTVTALPTRILHIEVEGNRHIEASYILEQAEYAGIKLGAKRSDVRSERVKNRLLSRMPELSWVGVNTKGCVAVIRVEEAGGGNSAAAAKMCLEIIAKCDGTIVDISVSAGRALCKTGDAVVQGQTLVSGHSHVGKIPVVGRAEGEIYAQTGHTISAVFPKPTRTYSPEAQTKSSYGCIIGNKKILFSKNSGKMYSGCGRIIVDKYVQLPGGFSLPVGYTVITEAQREEVQQSFSADWAEAYLKAYLKHHMISGTVLNSSFTHGDFNAYYEICGSFACTEEIGQTVSEGMD